MEGDKDVFDPTRSMTRAELMQTLYNLEGKPKTEADLDFTDIKDDAWYIPALKWSVANKIVEGYGGKAEPNESVTREQIVTILYRYAKYKGIDVSAGEDTNILSFSDCDEVGSWATSAMQWAVGSGLIEGRGTGSEPVLAPKEGAMRAEVATMIMRFCQKVLTK